MISLELQHEDLKKRYKELKNAHKKLQAEIIQLLESFDGHRAMDFWDESFPHSKGWEEKRYSFLEGMRGSEIHKGKDRQRRISNKRKGVKI